MNVAVIGANGFIGRNLLLGLAVEHRIFALDLGEGLSRFVSAAGLEGVEAASCDLTDPQALSALAATWPARLDAVIYLAGNGDPARSVTEPAFDLSHTTLGLVNFLQAFRADHFVYFSSGAVYDGIEGKVGPELPVSPVLPYAIGKLAAERYVHFFAGHGEISRFTILRFFGAYGPYEPPRKIYTKLVRAFALEKKRRFTIRGDGRNLIDAMYVADAVRALAAVLDSSGNSATLDFCVGKPFTLRGLVEAAARNFGIEPEIVCEGEVPEYIAFRPDARAFNERFGFSPAVPLEEGLSRLAEFLAANQAS